MTKYIFDASPDQMEEIKRVSLLMNAAIPDDVADAQIVVGAISMLLQNGFLLLKPEHVVGAFDEWAKKMRDTLEKNVRRVN